MPEPSDLAQDEWARLCETIRRGYCILVLGPDATIAPDIDNTHPICDQLAHLPFRLIIKTTHDRFIETALQAESIDKTKSVPELFMKNNVLILDD